MKIILDTNVLVAAFITRGVCSELLDHCIRHRELITSEFILGEFQQHLRHKFKYNTVEIEKAIKLLSLKVVLVTPVVLSGKICRDADDDAILGTAVAGEGDCIITGDKDLLVLKHFGSIDIISPSEFSNYEAPKLK